MAFTSVSRPHIIHRSSFLIILTLFILYPLPVFPQVDTTITPESEAALDEELRWLKAETYVITPSRIPEKIKKTASSITVITDRQIRQMGARNLMDVLWRAVPGVFADAGGNPGAANIIIRGRANTNSNTILFMINSHPINEAQTGGASWVHDTMIVDNIERIEVLRSPGSAVYGANAFVGVINIITKKAEDIDGLELIARGGKWDTQQYNLLYGKTFNEVEVAFNFNFFKTHGFRGVIEEDYQTQLDRDTAPSGFPPASLAPGRMAGDREKYDVALNLKYKGFEFDGRYVDKEHDLPIGWLNALNHKSISDAKDYYFNLSYGASIVEGLDLFGKVYRNVFDIDADYQILPPGSLAQTPFPCCPLVPGRDGAIIISSLKARRTGIEIQATYEIGDSNTVVSGATYEEQKQYDGSEGANFIPTPTSTNPDTVILLPWVIESPKDSQKRNLKAIFLEDIWDITDDLRLTLGVRYDRYSDFGDEVSPRVGLTWEFIEGYDLKLLYGHAFRAPSFWEIESSLSGIELDPETIDTYEISLGAEFTSSLSSRVTFYYRELEDAIVGTTSAAPWNLANASWTERDHGFEIEAEYNFGRGTYLAGHYIYLDFNGGAGAVHVGSIMSNIRLSRYLNFYADCQIGDGRERWPGDDRDDPPGGAVVNATLIAKKFLKGYEGLEFRGSVYNLLDKDHTSPTGPEIPNDIPGEGINFLLELRYSF